MPTTYLASKDFLLLLKMKKTNSIKDFDPLLKTALETELKPYFSQLADEIHGSNHSK